jgi:RNA-directed DNA polymerase
MDLAMGGAPMNSYFGLLRQASHSHADRARLAAAVLARGRCVDGAFTKTFGKDIA